MERDHGDRRGGVHPRDAAAHPGPALRGRRRDSRRGKGLRKHMSFIEGPVVPTADAIATLRPAAAVTLDPEGLLGGWQRRNADATLPHCVEQIDAYGNLANLRRVTGDAGMD